MSFHTENIRNQIDKINFLNSTFNELEEKVSVLENSKLQEEFSEILNRLKDFCFRTDQNLPNFNLIVLGSKEAGSQKLLKAFLTEEKNYKKDLIEKILIIDGKEKKICLYFVDSHITAKETAWADGFILLYDKSSKLTFQHLAIYYEKISFYCNLEVPMFLLGSKSSEQLEVISSIEGIRAALEFNCCEYFEIDLKDSFLVLSVIKEGIQSILKEKVIKTSKLQKSARIVRSLPLIQGFLFKASKTKKKGFKRCYCVLGKGVFSYYSSIKNYINETGKKSIDLSTCTLKKSNIFDLKNEGQSKELSFFTLPSSNKDPIQSPETPLDKIQNYTLIDNNLTEEHSVALRDLGKATMIHLTSKGILKIYRKNMKCFDELYNSKLISHSDLKKSYPANSIHLVSFNGPDWIFTCSNSEKYLQWISDLNLEIHYAIVFNLNFPVFQTLDFTSVLKIEGNECCVECNDPNPEWASINLGIFLCIECSGVHRHLSVQVSRVKSLYLDSWNSEWIKHMIRIGNNKSKSIWEKTLPNHYIRPSSTSSRNEKWDWCNSKYVLKSWIKPIEGLTNLDMEKKMISACINSNFDQALLILSHSSQTQILQATDLEGNTCLHHAIENGAYSIVLLLLLYGAKVNVNNHNNTSPLELAQRKNNQDIINLLNLESSKK